MCPLSAKTGKKKKIKKILPLFTVPFIFLFDRISKLAIIHFYQEGQGFALWPDVFHITRVNNTGAAFGILKNNALILTAISLLCVILLCLWIGMDLFYKYQRSGLLEALSANKRIYALAFVIAGASGNLYDRAAYGYVVDFLDFRVWPVFNVADMFICAGILWIVWDLFKMTKSA